LVPPRDPRKNRELTRNAVGLLWKSKPDPPEVALGPEGANLPPFGCDDFTGLAFAGPAQAKSGCDLR
jgi:hypothetical protein